MTRSEVLHWLHVARRSGPPWSRLFWLGLCHDLVEDGYLPARILSVWPALDFITRRHGEAYSDYIDRVAEHPDAAHVKRVDLAHNLTRGGGPSETLRRRYERAQWRLNLES